MPANPISSQHLQQDGPDLIRLWRAAGLAVVTLAFGVLAACGTSKGSTAAPAGSVPPVGSSNSSSSSGSSSSGPASTAASQSTAMIHISSYKFMTPASVSPGATVSVMNMDGEAHTVTADSGNAFDAKANPGTVVSFKAPTKPGSYPFHCDYHANMHGVLIVK
jgi:plastocyanin